MPMPKLGAGVYHEGVILKWMKKTGDSVKAGEPIAEIETEKSVAEYVSPASGTILKLLFNEGDTVEVGTPILLLGEPGEETPSAAPAGTVHPHTVAAPPMPAAVASVPAAPRPGAEVSPAARSTASPESR